MKIRNLTDKMQGLRVRELPGGEGYTIFIEAKGETVLQGAIVSERDEVKFDKGIFEYVGVERSAPKIEESIESEEVELITEDLEEESVEEESQVESLPEESTAGDGKFICEECGAEFASTRGLNSHMNRVHSGE